MSTSIFLRALFAKHSRRYSRVVFDMYKGYSGLIFIISNAGNKNRFHGIELKYEIPYDEIRYDKHVAKISVIGVGMRSHSGVASKAFQALANDSVNILMISTSEIKVTCLIEEKYTELAVRTLHHAFDLDSDSLQKS